LDSEIIYIQPNPEVYPDVIAVITQNNECELIRFMTNEIIATISNSTVVCWSPKGKQIVCGTRNGMILAYDIEGNQKDKITPPPSQTASVYGK
jgi:WD40 repeat protein